MIPEVPNLPPQATTEPNRDTVEPLEPYYEEIYHPEDFDEDDPDEDI